MLSNGAFPATLRNFLANPAVRKVGRMVNTDLRHLQLESQSATPFVGAIDLARLAKDRRIVSSAQAGLAELCALVLHRRLNKAIPERVSMAWENDELTQEPLSYAALDAYACLQIYKELIKISAPCPLPDTMPIPHTPILLYHTDNTRMIASGVISPHSADARFDGISITPKRTVITVQEVFIPGALVTTHNQRSLKSFGPPPFDVVCLRSHVRTRPVASTAPDSSQSTLSELEESSSRLPPGQDRNPTPPSPGPTSALPTLEELQNRETPELLDPVPQNDSTADTYEPSATGIADAVFDSLEELGTSEDSPADLPPTGAAGSQSQERPDLSTLGRDKDGEEYGRSLLSEWDMPSPLPGHDSESEPIAAWKTPIHSRVLKDPWHVFNMLDTPRNHGARIIFANALRDAIFIPDKGDKEKISRYLSTLPTPRTWETAVRLTPKWVWRHCKRLIPPPELLYPQVAGVFQTYGPIQDAKALQ